MINSNKLNIRRQRGSWCSCIEMAIEWLKLKMNQHMGQMNKLIIMVVI